MEFFWLLVGNQEPVKYPTQAICELSLNCKRLFTTKNSKSHLHCPL